VPNLPHKKRAERRNIEHPKKNAIKCTIFKDRRHTNKEKKSIFMISS
jgi:hypothetical protein